MLQKQEIHCWIEQRSKTIPFFSARLLWTKSFWRLSVKLVWSLFLSSIFSKLKRTSRADCVLVDPERGITCDGAVPHTAIAGRILSLARGDTPAALHCRYLLPPVGVTRLRETTADDDTKAEIRYFRFYYNWRWSLTLVDGCVSARFGTIIHCCVS